MSLEDETLRLSHAPVNEITVQADNPSVELVRFSQSGIWVNPDIPIDEVAQQVFALLEPMIVQSYTKAAAAAAKKEIQ